MSKTIQDIGGNAIVYNYPNGDFDIVCASEKWLKAPEWEVSFSEDKGRARAPAAREAGVKSQGEDQVRSMRRARANLRRLALANDFQYFVTLTLSPDRIDRYDPKAIMKEVNVWLSNQVQRHGLRYILVPEMHQDGAFHFHGFVAGNGLTMKNSGVKRSDRPVFNWESWGYGFTVCQELYGEYSRAVAYCCKYIGKQAGERPMGRWYYSGGKLAKPAKNYVTLDYAEVRREFEGEALEFQIPGTSMIVVHHHNI